MSELEVAAADRAGAVRNVCSGATRPRRRRRRGVGRCPSRAACSRSPRSIGLIALWPGDHRADGPGTAFGGRDRAGGRRSRRDRRLRRSRRAGLRAAARPATIGPPRRRWCSGPWAPCMLRRTGRASASRRSRAAATRSPASTAGERCSSSALVFAVLVVAIARVRGLMALARPGDLDRAGDASSSCRRCSPARPVCSSRSSARSP